MCKIRSWVVTTAQDYMVNHPPRILRDPRSIAYTMDSRLDSCGAVTANIVCLVEERIMSSDEREDTTIYKVVINHEEQYSIWPADRENPLGWRDVGKSGTKAECLEYIKEVWTDMRPLSLRQKMEEEARRGQ